jgi:hypothetical protein
LKVRPREAGNSGRLSVDRLGSAHSRTEDVHYFQNLCEAVQAWNQYQSVWIASSLAEILASQASAFAPGGVNYLLSKLPEIWESQSQRALRNAFDYFELLSRMQRQLPSTKD